MAQPISTEFSITREYLINNFRRMKGERGGAYTHFVPKQASGITAPVSDSNTYPIYECNCKDAMRRVARDIRVETPLLNKVKQIFDQAKPLILYSVGPGGCYQELSFCVKLAKEGRDVQQIVLVDRDYEDFQDLRVVHFTTFSKLLFPNVTISVYNEEKEYLEEIKQLKQSKPDIILCVDVEEAQLSFRRPVYREMLGSSSSQCIIAYHNFKDVYDPSKGTVTEIETIQGTIPE